MCCNSGRFFYTDSKNQHRYLRCPACALIWLSAQHYLPPADEHDHYQLHENDPQDLSYRRFLKQLWDPLRAKLTPGAIGLDYGSGPGPTLHLMATEDGFPCTHYDPLFHPDTSVLTEQYDFITEINTTVDLAHQSIKKIRAINEKLDAFVSAYSSDASVEDLVAKAKDLKDQFSEVEKALYQTQNRSGQDPLNFPIRLTNKLAHLNSLVSLDDFGPTVQDRAVKAELTTKIEEQLARFDALIEKEIDAFNEAFNQKQLPFL